VRRNISLIIEKKPGSKETYSLLFTHLYPSGLSLFKAMHFTLISIPLPLEKI